MTVFRWTTNTIKLLSKLTSNYDPLILALGNFNVGLVKQKLLKNSATPDHRLEQWSMISMSNVLAVKGWTTFQGALQNR